MQPAYYPIVIYDNYSKEDKENLQAFYINNGTVYLSCTDGPSVLEQIIAENHGEYLEPQFHNAFVHSDCLEDAKKDMERFHLRYKILDNDFEY